MFLCAVDITSLRDLYLQCFDIVGWTTGGEENVMKFTRSHGMSGAGYLWESNVF